MKKYFYIQLIFFLPVVFTHAQTCAPVTVPLAATISQQNITCFGSNNGSVSVNFTSGNPPYTYNWSPNVGSTSGASGLSPGTYSVMLTDAGCNLSGPNLVVNGDFSAGNAGFSSGYTVCVTANCLLTAGAFQGAGYYAIGANTQFYHPSFWGCGHSTAAGTDPFMIVNGITTPKPTAMIGIQSMSM